MPHATEPSAAVSKRSVPKGVIVLLLPVFVLLAVAVASGITEPFDRSIILSLRHAADLSDPIGPQWVEEAVRDVTALGSTTGLSLLVIAVTTFLALTSRGRLALTVLACTLAGTALSSLAKLLFARPRPDLVPHSVEVYTASFPSGHALMSAVVYLTLAALIAKAEPTARVRTATMIFAVALTIMVGVSRVYLGVHWPTDVLAGWCLGAVWAAVCSLIVDRAMAKPAGPN